MEQDTQRLIHVAVDINNAHVSAQLDQRGERVHGTRLRVSAVVDKMVAGRDVAQAFAATTTSPTRDGLAQAWSTIGFGVRRLNPDAGGHESGVDESLHAKILSWTSRQYSANIQPILILLTGDANCNDGGTTVVLHFSMYYSQLL